MKIFLTAIYLFNFCERRKIFLIAIFFLLVSPGFSQKIVGYGTVYDDRLDKWQVLAENPEQDGTIEATWALMDDWTEWQYTVGEHSGWIRLRQKNNPDIWEVVGEGQILEVRTIFPGEFDHWQVRYQRKTYDVKVWRNDPEQWQVRTKEEGKLSFFTYQERDIRDWVIENEMDYPVPLQIALTFVPILQLVIR